MVKHIQSSIHALVKGFNSSSADSLSHEIDLIFHNEDTYEEKVKGLDLLIEKHPDYQELSEILFDLLLVKFLHTDAALLDPDYLESQEWSDIEDKYLDRGTEMLNIFLYLQECMDENLEPDLEDFLQEFLLVEDDGFSEEQAIYEPFIENQDLIEAEVSEVIQAGLQIPQDHPVKEIFIPFMLFFMNDVPLGDRVKAISSNVQHPALSSAYLCCLDSFYQP